jgi:hypothetical protein
LMAYTRYDQVTWCAVRWVGWGFNTNTWLIVCGNWCGGGSLQMTTEHGVGGHGRIAEQGTHNRVVASWHSELLGCAQRCLHL